MQTLKFRAKIDSIEGNEIHYALPQRIYEASIENLDEPRVIDPANPKREFLELAKSTYVGSKRRLRKKIVSLVPDEVRSVFDPMSGFSSILRELGEQGKEVWGNDLNLVSYFYSRALFLKAKPSEQEFKAFLESVQEKEGYFAKCDFWKSVKIPMNYKKFIDGFILKAQESENPSFYLGVAANYLSSACGSFGGPYHPPRAGNFQIGILKHSLLRDMEEIARCKAVGKFTSKDARTMEFPNVDLIYFDPPYYESDPTYFKRYSKINSILSQKDWDLPSEITQKEVEEIGKKLSHHCDLLLISSTAKCPISWKEALSDPRREVTQKRFTLTGTGLDNASVTMNRKALSEHLWISAKKSLVEVVKAADPFMIYLPEDEKYRYVIQTHWRGRSCHWDIRTEGLQKQYLLGWTVFVQRAGTMKEPVQTLGQAREAVGTGFKYFKVNHVTGEWASRERKGKKVTRISLVATRKAVEPVAWRTFQGVVPKGSVGATRFHDGVFLIVDQGEVQYGAKKPWLHEAWMDGKVLKFGRYIFRQLKAWRRGEKKSEAEEEGEEIWKEITELNQKSIQIFKDGGMTEQEIQDWIKPQLVEAIREFDLEKIEIREAFVIPPGKEEGLGTELGWLMISPTDQVPYILSARAEKEKWLPPSDFSALPRHWRKHVLPEEQYWKMSGAKALEARKVLRQRLRKEGVLTKAEEGEVDPFGTKKDLDVEKEARHRADQCMTCSKPPKIEVLWAEGMGHAWFCLKCFKKWMREEPDRYEQDLDAAKLIKDGKASKKFSENRNPNIRDKLFTYFPDLKTEKKKALTPEEVDSLIPKDDSRQPSLTADFRLTYQWWKKVKVIREGPSKAQYHIWFKTSKKKVLDFLSNDNILEVSETGGILHKDRTETDFATEGYVKPGTKLNPTKATPSFIKPLDRGKAVLLIDIANLKKIQFKGSKLKGTFLFKNIEGYWEIKRVQEAPKG